MLSVPSGLSVEVAGSGLGHLPFPENLARAAEHSLNPVLDTFLRKNPEVIQQLGGIRTVLARVFGDVAAQKLEILEFADSNESSPKLFVSVRTRMSVEEASAALARFDDEFWVEVPSSVRAKVIVDVAFEHA